jgi:hypothetical protein
MGRIKDGNCLWVLCCCGCLPIIGIIKGALVLPFGAVLAVVPCTLAAIVMLPHGACNTIN